MHVKEQVKEFVHDVKRRFSHKRKRETCSTFDSFDGASSYSSADTLSHLDDSSSSSVSSVGSTSERSRFIKFIRPRVSSTISKKRQHNVLHRVRKSDGKRYRLFSAPTVPSERMVESSHKQAASYQGPPGPTGHAADEQATLGRLREDYSDVIDISAQGSAAATPEAGSTQTLSRGADRDSLSQSQPLFDAESHSDTSGTLVTATSGPDHSKSASKSDSHLDSVDLHSDEKSERVPIDLPIVSTPLIDPMADVPPLPPPKATSPREEEEITLASSQPPPVNPLPQVITPAQTSRSTPPSPAPVYIPRLTAPSMFLPIPNINTPTEAVALASRATVSSVCKFPPIPTSEAIASATMTTVLLIPSVPF